MISYEELSLVFDMENPLTLEYFEICDKHTDEPKYFEKHHILPVTMFDEYKKSEWNLIRLTYQNHYRVHELLPFICVHERDRNKMAKAWRAMKNTKEHIDVDSVLYAELRQLHKDSMLGENNPFFGRRHTDEILEGIRQKNIGRKHNEEVRRKKSLQNSGEGNPMFGKKQTPESRAKNSAANMGRIITDEMKEKIRASTTGENHWIYRTGYVTSEETKSKMTAAKIRPEDDFRLYLSTTSYTMVGEYKSMSTATEFKCSNPEHPPFRRLPSDLQRGMVCKLCNVEEKKVRIEELRRQILRVRRVEEAIANEYSKLEIRQPVHLDIGSEHVSVGMCGTLRSTDKVFGSHRSHSLYLACDGDLNKFVSELMGKSDGCSNGGIGGSMHLSSDGIFVASTSIVAGTIPVAVGAAFAEKLSGSDNVICVFFGDGAAEEGACLEAFNFAVLHQLPIIFVCSNNSLAVTTKIKDRQGDQSIYSKAKAFGLNAVCCKSVNVEYVDELARKAIREARKGKPQFIEFLTERQRQHCGVSHEFILQNDPLEGYTTDESKITEEIEAAFEFARQSPAPTEVRNVYAD